MPSVLVTGAGRGIGKAIDEHLASRGWDVIAGICNERDATAVTALNPQRISSVTLDVTDSEHIAALTESLPERLDAIVNNAGVVVSGLAETVTTDEWRKQLDVNVIGIPEDSLPRRKGVRRRRGGADGAQAPRPLRRRRRPQTAGGVDDEPPRVGA